AVQHLVLHKVSTEHMARRSLHQVGAGSNFTACSTRRLPSGRSMCAMKAWSKGMRPHSTATVWPLIQSLNIEGTAISPARRALCSHCWGVVFAFALLGLAFFQSAA